MRKTLLCGLFVTLLCSVGLAQINQPGGGGGLPAGLTYVAPTLTVSSAGNGNGALALSGNTSGTATFTAPAVAGTSTNPVTMTNVLSGPTGSAAASTYGDATGAEGLSFVAVAGSGAVTLSAGSTAQFGVANTGTGVFIPSGNCYGLTSGTLANAADTALCRFAAGVVQVGTAAGNSNGVLKAAAFRGGGAAAALSGTGACATFSGQVGGSSTGSAACASATAASTLTITPGTTAPTGWACNVQDETTRANLFQQTSHTTTSCTLTITSVTQNDVFVFTASQF